METASVTVRWNDKVPDNDSEIGVVVSKIDSLIRNEELLSYPLSIVALLNALPGEGPAETRMSLLELLPPPLKRAYYNPERRQAHVEFRVQDLGIARYGEVL